MGGCCISGFCPIYVWWVQYLLLWDFYKYGRMLKWYSAILTRRLTCYRSMSLTHPYVGLCCTLSTYTILDQVHIDGKLTKEITFRNLTSLYWASSPLTKSAEIQKYYKFSLPQNYSIFFLILIFTSCAATTNILLPRNEPALWLSWWKNKSPLRNHTQETSRSCKAWTVSSILMALKKMRYNFGERSNVQILSIYSKQESSSWSHVDIFLFEPYHQFRKLHHVKIHG